MPPPPQQPPAAFFLPPLPAEMMQQQQKQPIIVVANPQQLPQTTSKTSTIFIIVIGAATALSTVSTAITIYLAIAAPDSVGINLAWLRFWAWLAGVAAVEVAFWLAALQLYGSRMIAISITLSIVSIAASGIANLIVLNIVGAVILLVVALAKSVWWYIMRDHVAFAAGLLETSIAAIRQFPQLAAVWGGALMAMTLLCFLLMQCISATWDSRYSLLLQIGVVVFFGLLIEMVKNIVFMTVAGVVASWYTNGAETALREGAVYKSLVRVLRHKGLVLVAGSIVMFQLKLPKYLLRKARGSSSLLLKCCCMCCLAPCSCVLDLYNTYALSYAMLHDVSWWEAARESSATVQRLGLDAILFDSVLDDVISLGPALAAVSVAGVASVLYAIASYIPSGFLNWLLAVMLGAGTGYGFMIVALSGVDAALASFFLCVAASPFDLKRHRPDLYDKLVNMWGARQLPSPDWLATEL